MLLEPSVIELSEWKVPQVTGLAWTAMGGAMLYMEAATVVAVVVVVVVVVVAAAVLVNFYTSQFIVFFTCTLIDSLNYYTTDNINLLLQEVLLSTPFCFHYVSHCRQF
ncbi:unnamed protein product [Polarella glacialis]|uniref:Uncharacterized protein n=1 Tax=Polarella glacialis TaxID=89957 RepID=A0A813LXY3_POLGL|nr:unnamed protein product [Polarella glacialis]